MLSAVEEQVLRSIPRTEGAHYLSAANAMKARFQQGTRARVFDALSKWEEGTVAEGFPQPVCVLVGEAGTGKSTIASEFAKRLQARDPPALGASFFFTRGVQDLNSPRKFFSTIASQLACSQSALRIPVVNAAREHLKTATLQQLEHEFQNLILKPLSTLPPSHPPFFVVIDALDECTEEGSELVPILLRLFLSCATRAGSPLRVFLTSRPEPHYIHHVFTTPDLQPFISTIFIQDFRGLVDMDIELLILAKFSEQGTSKLWAETHPEAVTALAKKSAGLFIYARTAVDFILGDPGDSLFQLTERYEDLIKGDGAVGLDPLDTLYCVVLKGVFYGGYRHDKSQERLKRVLGYLVALLAPKGISPTTLESLTGMGTDESVPILNKLRSVIFFERDNVHARFRIIHATFREYLSRSNDVYHVDPGPVHAYLVNGCMKVLRMFITERWGGSTGASLLVRLLTKEPPQDRDQDLPDVQYAVTYVEHHQQQSLHSTLVSQISKEDQGYVPSVLSVVRFALSPRYSGMWTMMSALLAHLCLPSPAQRLVDALNKLLKGRFCQAVCTQ